MSPSSADTADEAKAAGRVVSGHGRHVVVEAAGSGRVLCHARGKKSECVVGDEVIWQRTGDEGVVDRLLPRRNLLYRQDEWRTKAFAANIDQLLFVVAAEPVFSESQMARALIAAAEAAIPSRIVLNKKDLPSFDLAEQRLRPYAAMGIDVQHMALKAEPEQTYDQLGCLLRNKATLVLGPSGAGKSTLVNLMVGNAKAQVGEVSQALKSGRHTTTTTEWYWIDAGRTSALIDSPGFQEFGLHHIEPLRLAALMPDIARHADGCRFYNCLHLHEPGCGVLAALERGEITESRHRIYREILDELRR